MLDAGPRSGDHAWLHITDDLQFIDPGVGNLADDKFGGIRSSVRF
jgi:hypothetical protein